MDSGRQPGSSLTSSLAGLPEHLQVSLQEASRQIAMAQEHQSRPTCPQPEHMNAFNGQRHSNYIQGQGHPQARHSQPQQRYPQGKRRSLPHHSQPPQFINGPPPHHDSQSFPILGSPRPQAPAHPHLPDYQPSKRHEVPAMSDEAVQAFFTQANDGAYRRPPTGSRQQHHHPRKATFGPSQHQMRCAPMQQNEFMRPPPHRTQSSNTSNASQTMLDPLSNDRERVMLQCDYMSHLASKASTNELGPTELKEKEAFRQLLEGVAQGLVAEYAKDNPFFNPEKVRLKCYGSLANGFAMKGSDMDLLLMFPRHEASIGSIEIQSRRMLEKALLDLGFGARLLTNTRVPILRVCQSPSARLLYNLREYRKKWESDEAQAKVESSMDSKETRPSPYQLPPQNSDPMAAVSTAFSALDVAADTPLPPSPVRELTDLEFKGDVGIQCDINFSNYVAVHNTALLRCYCKCDPRVRQIGLFIKAWAKIRKINTPYHGTLSSYGYILMVLHFLMNIARPPLIPNLQHEKKDADAWNNKTDIELFEGFDVRFMDDEHRISKLAQAGKITANTQSIGSLLRDFFWYYSNPRGFHWGLEVISIRTRGGILTKKSKGWTEAKRTGENNQIRLRFLCAIEDPFEIEHNIGRTVGHSGVVSIRDEFRRAWTILNTIQFNIDKGWHWFREDGSIGEDLLDEAEDRGDLLRKDMEYHRKKERDVKEMLRARAEANAEASLEASVVSTEAAISDRLCDDGMSPYPPIPKSDRTNGNLPSADRSRTQLTDNRGTFQEKPRKKGRIRRVRDEIADEECNGKVADQQVEDQSQSPQKYVKSTQHNPEVGDYIPSRTGESDFKFAFAMKDLTCKLGPHESGKLPSWNSETKFGSWLIWRDKLVREGNWQERHGNGNGWNARLHRLFPYDPLRPPPNLAQQRQNALVRARRTRYFAAQDQRQSLTKEGNSTTDGQTQSQPQLQMDSGNAGHAQRLSTAAPKPNTHRSTERRTWKKNITASRDHFSGSETADLPVPDNTHSLQQKSLFGNGSLPFSPMSDPLPDALDNFNHGSNVSLSVSSANSSAAFSRREDDPKIMPILQFPGFEFDPRQLRDLAIIRKGGNGCARKGEEYGVEIEGEFGGGGWMGIKSSTTADMGISGSGEIRGYEVGRGDEEGLLDELPGL